MDGTSPAGVAILTLIGTEGVDGAGELGRGMKAGDNERWSTGTGVGGDR